jgi:type I restriction enzyme R subunit
LDNLTEARTRKDLIDPALEKAGWGRVGQSDLIGCEIPVGEPDPGTWRALQRELRHLHDQGIRYEAGLSGGISDYVLRRANGEIAAIVEAKRASVDPRLAEAQARFYVAEIGKRQSFRPFAFMTNGYEIYFWDVDRANKRLVSGFFAPADLENLLYLRENGTALAVTEINVAITDRTYQQEAVRRVCEAFDAGKRKALIVMATGTGKTRVAMSLVDVFMRSNQARRILFVADRDALVKQAMDEGFIKYVPDEPCARISTHNVSAIQTKRLYVATLQTLSNCFERFTPAFFDLIVFDEVHRSIFNRWNDVLQYFDGRMIGLTATPAAFIDRNTFLEFDCHDGTPTFLYEYEDAIGDGYLVDYSLYAARTRFQRRGIRGVDLGEEERNTLIQQGIDPDDLDFSGTDLEKEVSNRDTLRKQWEEIWEVCYKDASGQLPGKSIVFAMTQEHALRLADVFEEMYPQHPGMVQVITYKSEYKGTLIDRFKKSDMPRIAISVDMLETGINVPEVVNLVLMRPVHSRIKLEQMIGRGTRTHETCSHTEWLPGGHKKDFQILDFWENDFSKRPQEQVAQSLPVLVTLFNTRLKLLELFLARSQEDETRRTIADLRAQIALIPTDAFTVRRIYPEVQEAWQDKFWEYLTPDRRLLLQRKVGPLLRHAPAVDVEAATFASKVERLKLQILTGQDARETAASIREDVIRLPLFAYDAPERRQARRVCLAPGLETASVAELNQVIDCLAGQMRNRRQKPDTFVLLDLPDFVEMRGYILLHGGSEPVYVQEYRRRVEERILDLVARHPTIEAIDRGEAVSDAQLIALERTLRHELGGAGMELDEDKVRKAYGFRVGSLLEFLRRLLEMDGIPDYAEIVRRQFDGYIGAHPFSADQIRFLHAVQSVLIQNHELRLADLYEPPLTAFGADAVERWFQPGEVQDVLAFARTLTLTGE